jgi:hypothetical protein
MGDMRNTHKISVGTPEGKRPLRRLGVDGKIILKWKCVDWIHVTQHMVQWRVLVNTITSLRDP